MEENSLDDKIKTVKSGLRALRTLRKLLFISLIFSITVFVFSFLNDNPYSFLSLLFVLLEAIMLHENTLCWNKGISFLRDHGKDTVI